MVFFDAVLAANGTVLFNGIQEEAQKFIRENASVLGEDCVAVRGRDLEFFSLEDYLKL
jgi:hypothetical protein